MSDEQETARRVERGYEREIERLESENARLRVSVADLETENMHWANAGLSVAGELRGLVEHYRHECEKQASQLSALREALADARQTLQWWAVHPDAAPYPSWDPPHTIQDPNGTRAALTRIDVALASTEPGGEEG